MILHISLYSSQDGTSVKLSKKRTLIYRLCVCSLTNKICSPLLREFSSLPSATIPIRDYSGSW